MKTFRLTFTIAAVFSTITATQAQQIRYNTTSLTVNRNGNFLTAIDASGRQVAHVDFTKPALKGKVVAFAYSSKKRETAQEAAEPVTSLTLFPNPASKQVQLDLKGTWKFPVDVKILDRNGNMMQNSRMEAENRILNIASLRQGIYILKAESGSSKAVEKLVVE